MNHDGPRQRQTDGLWAYTTANDREKTAMPIGYCRPWREWSEETIQTVWLGNRDRYEEYARPRRVAAAAGKYHDGGHATAEEACACYKEHLLDFELRFHEGAGDPDTLNRCRAEGCAEFTAGSASVGGWHHWPLCAAHRTREVVAGLLTVGESWHS